MTVRARRETCSSEGNDDTNQFEYKANNSLQIVPTWTITGHAGAEAFSNEIDEYGAASDSTKITQCALYPGLITDVDDRYAVDDQPVAFAWTRCAREMLASLVSWHRTGKTSARRQPVRDAQPTSSTPMSTATSGIRCPAVPHSGQRRRSTAGAGWSAIRLDRLVPFEKCRAP
jgi:hypothetical protein